MSTTELQLFADGSTTFDPESFAPNGVRGPDKVVQRVLYALNTPLGSVPSQPTVGCDFLRLAAGFSSEYDVHTAFAASVSSVLATVRSYESDSDPDDEKLSELRLADIEISGDGVTIAITITTKDGSKPSQTVDFVIEV